ncbi:DNA starvation/stationary phase protection protein Dps [Acuticoccus yangtzensis]|uniref:DNA starvation/stationary phase protection protein Dps n=1 Tax=Acuticoccus yangtzensis TaxID=1443441 RepID=UPI000949B071|nr:DNA starvation/stationary phase protection protein Dps [Acuticoccus yangtzensis]ORE94667.1 ferritin Dps family protein [Stappia sp. 22II-S9-Z10]
MKAKKIPTSTDISEQTRKAMVGVLQANLADGIDLVYQLKQAHWTARGPNFIGFHELLDDLHEQIEEKVDLTAERIAVLGGQAEGTVDVSAQTSRLPKYPMQAVAIDEHVEAVTKSLAAYAENIRKAIDEASEAGDEGTADLFTEISRTADRARWFVEAHKVPA